MVLSEADVERFWSHVKVGQIHECWLWMASKRPKRDGGHGRFRVRDSNEHAHRVALASTGVDVDGKVVRHRCDTADCQNPSHLATGTQLDNVQDMIDRNRLARGEANGQARLTEAQVIKMRVSKLSHYVWAKRLGVDDATVSKARRGITWAYLNDDYPPIHFK